MPAARRRARAVVVGAFAFFCVYFTGFFPPFWNPNELSRFETVVAFVETGHVLDRRRSSPRSATTRTRRSRAGASTRTRRPGLAFAAIPVYRLLRVVFPPPDSPTAPDLRAAAPPDGLARLRPRARAGSRGALLRSPRGEPARRS